MKPPRRRRTLLAIVAVATLIAVLVPPPVALGRQAGRTIVSLTFDDGRASSYTARSILAAHGMHGTFYLISPKVGSGPGYLTWSQVNDLAADGNEIGGHTAYHLDLTRVDAAEAQREICYDRVSLLNHGFQVTDFAYPHGAYNPAVETMVRECGYNSARTIEPAPVAETNPPADPYAIRIGSLSNSLAALEAAVDRADQNGGGWVPIVFHDICDGCSSAAVSVADFTAFLDWLQQKPRRRVVVQTVRQVIGGVIQAPVAGPPLPAPPNGSNGLHNASFETRTAADQPPDCWQYGGYGGNNATWSWTTDAHTGSRGERVDVTAYASGDQKALVQQDLGGCTPSVIAGRQYRITTWYTSTAPASFTVFTRDSQWLPSFWIKSPAFPPAADWTLASWITPPVPSGVNGLAFGLAISANGTLTVDDAAIDDANPSGASDTTPPAVVLTAPGTGATVTGNVDLAATATDNVAVDHVDFLVDGSVIGSATASPYGRAWDSRTVPDGTHAISARAVDTAGNVATTAPIAIAVANQALNLIQNPSLEATSGSIPTCWILGGYGSNTFTWTRTTDAHSGSAAERLDLLSQTSGDRKLVTSQDAGACAPAVSVGQSYVVTAWYKSSVQPSMFAYYRTSSGSWVYWAQSPLLPGASDWTLGSWTLPPVPSGATHISVGIGLKMPGSLTMDDFSLTAAS